ncbi:hypothetical protein Pcinc_020508 [Petrolisthes cinctipes]|uniref:Sulfotransferase n=1 Tax=Petrolisthes cinctipes TaxID=88211 RepID=A0AAE1FJ10_PETCI|nr:hypothetical protein Pcinc_020508 [Petrolisthes cinctipes]
MVVEKCYRYYFKAVRKAAVLAILCVSCVLVLLTYRLPLPSSLTLKDPSLLYSSITLEDSSITLENSSILPNHVLSDGVFTVEEDNNDSLGNDPLTGSHIIIHDNVLKNESESGKYGANSSNSAKSLPSNISKSISVHELTNGITDLTARINNTSNIEVVASNNQSSFTINRRGPRHEMRIDWRRRWERPWRSDSSCQQYYIGFATVGSLRPCALASYPGSGNTWTRQLLQAATGIFTGSIYRDQQLFISGYTGELEAWDSGTTFTQKTHQCSPEHIKQFNGTGILLLRNPYRAILAYHNYLFGGHIGFAPVSNYRRKDWGTFVHIQARSWLDAAVNWTRYGGSVHVLHYEHLRNDPALHLAKALTFTGITPLPHRLKCLMKQVSPGFKRHPEYIPEGLTVFSEKDRDKLDRAVRYVDYLLRQHHHTPLPLHLYDFYNHTSSQMLEVKCRSGETTAQCDERVDRLNHARTRVERRRPARQDHKGSAGDTVTIQVRGRKEEKKQDPLKKFVSTKVGWFMTKAFTDLMKFGFTDPISRIVGEVDQS